MAHHLQCSLKLNISCKHEQTGLKASGIFQVDFGYFGPPEEHLIWSKELRQGTYVTPDDPSSEIGGEVAAALGAAAVAFTQTDPAYAARLTKGAIRVSFIAGAVPSQSGFLLRIESLGELK